MVVSGEYLPRPEGGLDGEGQRLFAVDGAHSESTSVRQMPSCTAFIS